MDLGFSAGTYTPTFGCLRLFTGEMGMVATGWGVVDHPLPWLLLEPLYPNPRRQRLRLRHGNVCRASWRRWSLGSTSGRAVGWRLEAEEEGGGGGEDRGLVEQEQAPDDD